MAATGTFSIDPAQISQSGAKFQQFSQDYRTNMMQLRSAIEDLGGCWKSEDYNQFVAIYQQNAEIIDQMSKAFASFGDILTTTSANVNTASEELRSTFK